MTTSLTIHQNIATITLLGSDKQTKHPWGTLVSEHRWNPLTVHSLKQHLITIQKDPNVHCVIVTGQGRFWSNGLDLAWVDTHTEQESSTFIRELNDLMLTLLCFPIPTIAALNGHWCAAGGMMGLCFDYRVMNQDKGYFFVPAVDLGVVYSSFQIELMKAKLPFWMHRDIIVFNSTRWQAHELLTHRVIDRAVSGNNVMKESVLLSKQLIQTKGHGPSRIAMGPIKQKVYQEVIVALKQDSSGLMVLNGRKKGDNYAPPLVSKM